MQTKLGFLMALMIVSCVASAQSACDTLTKAAEKNIKEMSYSVAAGMFSSEGETNRRLEKVYVATALQSNLMLMQANKCPMPKAPVSDTEYSKNAMECVLAASKAQRLGDKGALSECDRATWTRQAN